MFTPSATTVGLLLEASPALQLEMAVIHHAGLVSPREDEASRKPVPEESTAAYMIADDVTGVLGMVGRRRAVDAPGSQMLITSPTAPEGFSPEVARPLCRQWSMSRKAPSGRKALSALAKDLHNWVSVQPDEASLLGLGIEERSAQVVMTCRPLEPVLEPLSD
jgi:hypothetical protein